MCESVCVCVCVCVCMCVCVFEREHVYDLSHNGDKTKDTFQFCLPSYIQDTSLPPSLTPPLPLPPPHVSHVKPLLQMPQRQSSGPETPPHLH